MEPISIDPTVAAIGAQVVAGAAQGMSAVAAASPAVTALPPAGADEVSIGASTAFAAEGAATSATITAAQEELARAGAALTDITRIYAETDGAAASALTSAGSEFVAPGSQFLTPGLMGKPAASQQGNAYVANSYAAQPASDAPALGASAPNAATLGAVASDAAAGASASDATTLGTTLGTAVPGATALGTMASGGSSFISQAVSSGAGGAGAGSTGLADAGQQGTGNPGYADAALVDDTSVNAPVDAAQQELGTQTQQQVDQPGPMLASAAVHPASAAPTAAPPAGGPPLTTGAGIAAPNLSTTVSTAAQGMASPAGAPAVGPVGPGASAGGAAPVSQVSESASAGGASGRRLAPPVSSVDRSSPAGEPAHVSLTASSAGTGPVNAASSSGVAIPAMAPPFGRDRGNAVSTPKAPQRGASPDHLSGRTDRWSVVDLFSLHGKRALVTGASGGIGHLVALAYLQAGAKVAIAAQDAEALEKAAAEIGAAGEGEVVPLPCDLDQPDQVATLLGQVTAELGGIDIAVCNAGAGSVRGMLDMPVDEFQRIQDTNVTGVFVIAQAAARAMVAQGHGGAIINTASISGHIINVPQQVGHYCAAKAAVIHLTKAMAVEFAPHQIRVNSVSPGYIAAGPDQPPPEYDQQLNAKIPLGRMGRPDELAGLYLYLASAASSYMTGSDIVIDGGYTCL